jgi:hypothetical protein
MTTKLVTCLLVVVAGCGGGNNSSKMNGDGTPAVYTSVPAVDNFLQATAQARCDWEFRCCKDTEIAQLDKTKFKDAASCVPFRLLDLKDALWLDRQAVGSSRMKVDDAAAAACLTTLKALACNLPNGQPPPMMNPMGIDPCSRVLVGAVPAGGECLRAVECAAGTRCITGGGQSRGVCEPLQAIGDICNNSLDCDQTAQSAYCNQAEFKCRARSKIGGPCSYTDSNGQPTLPLIVECDTTGANVYCDPASKTCKAYPQNGEPCLGNNIPGILSKCDTDPKSRLTCDTSNGQPGVCRAPGVLGSDCTRIMCDATLDLYCDFNQKCAALPTLMESCARTNRCKTPYYCDNNSRTCIAPAQLGDNCQTVTCDVNLYCDTNNGWMCAARLADGSPCSSSNQCLSNNCAFGNGMTRTCQTIQVQPVCSGR